MESLVVDEALPLDQVPLIVSKYELTRAVGLRAQMLQQGGRPVAPYSRQPDALACAASEVHRRAVAFALCREIQGGDQFVELPEAACDQ